jgi:hypothetical protein
MTSAYAICHALIRCTARARRGIASLASHGDGAPDVDGLARSVVPTPWQRNASELIYELLDAHYDTMLLANELKSEPSWEGHLEYLRGLQRVGRETLAQSSVERVR